jgi:hypothetical protein
MPKAARLHATVQRPQLPVSALLDNNWPHGSYINIQNWSVTVNTR